MFEVLTKTSSFFFLPVSKINKSILVKLLNTLKYLLKKKSSFFKSSSRKPLENFILQGFFKKNFVLLKSFFKETSFFKSSSMKTLFFKSPSTKNFASTYLGGSGDCHLDSLIPF